MADQSAMPPTQKPESKWRRFLKGVALISPHVWPVTIALTLIIIGIGVYNIYLQISSDRPLLVATEARLFRNQNANPPEIVNTTWGNVGKRTLHRGLATFYTTDEKFEKRVKYGSYPLDTSVPTYGHPSAAVPVDMTKYLGVFLVCTTYYDDDNHEYEQAFLFRRPEKHAESGGFEVLQELPPSKSAHCT